MVFRIAFGYVERDDGLKAPVWTVENRGAFEPPIAIFAGEPGTEADHEMTVADMMTGETVTANFRDITAALRRLVREATNG